MFPCNHDCQIKSFCVCSSIGGEQSTGHRHLVCAHFCLVCVHSFCVCTSIGCQWKPACVQSLSTLFVCTLLLVASGSLPVSRGCAVSLCVHIYWMPVDNCLCAELEHSFTISAYAVLLVPSGLPPQYSGFGAGSAVHRGPGQQPYIYQISL